ncbi:MAG: hypothetical protein WBA17_12650 [Saprospiraceae bacterium]
MNTSEEYWENKLRETVQDYEFTYDPMAWTAMNGLLNQLPPLGVEGSATTNSAAAGKAGSMLGGLAPKLVAAAVCELVVGLLMVGYIGVITLAGEPAVVPAILPQPGDFEMAVPAEPLIPSSMKREPSLNTPLTAPPTPTPPPITSAADITTISTDTALVDSTEATPKTFRIDLLPARPLSLPQSLRRGDAGTTFDSLSLNISPKTRSRKTLYPDVINNY